MQLDNSGEGKIDKSNFIFSIDKNKKFATRNDNYSIVCASFEGPRFWFSFPEIYLNGTLDKVQSFDTSFCTFT